MCRCGGSDIPRRREWLGCIYVAVTHAQRPTDARTAWSALHVEQEEKQRQAANQERLLAIPKPQLRSKQGEACQIERALFSWKLDGFGHACLVLKPKKSSQYPAFKHCKMKGVSGNKKEREREKQGNSCRSAYSQPGKPPNSHKSLLSSRYLHSPGLRWLQPMEASWARGLGWAAPRFLIHRNCEIINVYCFKPCVTCYTVMDKLTQRK